MTILGSNVGSTTLTFKLYEMPQEKVLCSGKVERVGSIDDAIFLYENHLTGERISEICGISGYTEGRDQEVYRPYDCAGYRRDRRPR